MKKEVFYCECGVGFEVPDNGQIAIKIYCPKCKKEISAENKHGVKKDD